MSLQWICRASRGTLSFKGILGTDLHVGISHPTLYWAALLLISIFPLPATIYATKHHKTSRWSLILFILGRNLSTLAYKLPSCTNVCNHKFLQSFKREDNYSFCDASIFALAFKVFAVNTLITICFNGDYYKLSQEPLDQTLTCLYLVWCIFYADSEYGHIIYVFQTFKQIFQSFWKKEVTCVVSTRHGHRETQCHLRLIIWKCSAKFTIVHKDVYLYPLSTLSRSCISCHFTTSTTNYFPSH